MLFVPPLYLGSIASGILLCAVLHAIHRHRPASTEHVVAVELAIFLALVGVKLKDRVFLTAALQWAAKLAGTHVSSFILGTILYRVSPFHPLSHFPGPIINKITSIPAAYRTFTGERPFYVEDIHKRYGRAVRLGPDFVSINSVDALAPIYGSTSTMTKSRAYTFGGAKGDGLFFMKDRNLHSKRRKLWAPAFSQNIIRTFREVTNRRCHQFLDVIETRGDSRGVVNMGELLCHFTYDLMLDIVFGGSNPVNMLGEGDPDRLIRSGQLATLAFETLGEIPSLTTILWRLPISKRMRALEERAGAWMEMRRRAQKVEQDDIASFFLGREDSTQALSDADLQMDSLFAIQAGSDTPAGVLTLIYFYLVKRPDVYQTLRDELDAAFPDPNAKLDIHKLTQLPYLNAVIMEGMRIGTPFHGFPRIVPKDGALIDRWFVPGGTTVSVPGWSVHIDEENFYPEPLAFHPQRWMPGGLGPGSRTNKAAWMAFSIGSYGCLGKQVAHEELLATIAYTTIAYDLSFPPEFDWDKFLAGVLNSRTPFFREKLLIAAKRRHV